MTPEGTPQGASRSSRSKRSARRRHRRTAEVLVAVVVLAGGLWYAVGRANDDVDASAAASSGAATRGTAHFLSFQVVGGSAPMLAVMAAAAGDINPSAIPIPPGLTLVMPGQGEMETSAVARLPGASVQVALSNSVGVWTQDYLVMTAQQLGVVVGRTGGLMVDLPDVYTTSVGVLGPGPTTLSGSQVAAFLQTRASDPELRWETMLTALMADPPTLTQPDVRSTNSLAGAQETLNAVTGGAVLPMPVKDVAGATTVTAQPEFDGLMSSTFGTAEPTSAIVQNGNGAPGVGEDVAREIIPAGFRVTLSQNAQTFDVVTTSVIANGTEYAEAARRAQAALGVGRVGASQVPSGIGDILIVVGKDFTA